MADKLFAKLPSFSARLTASGKFRIFSVKAEPRILHALVDKDILQGDWTFEPAMRWLSPVERLHVAQRREPAIYLYAPTYATPEEALQKAEEWEEKN